MPPALEYVQPTLNNNQRTDSNFTIAVNATTYGGATRDTFRYRVYNASVILVSETYTNSSNLTIADLGPGTYTYNVWVNDSAGETATTSDRVVVLMKSCLSLPGCGEGSSCVIWENCYLHSGMCSDNECDFTNMTLNSTIYTLHDANGNGRELKLKLTSNAQRSPLTFLRNSSVVFSGRNGSDLGSGSAGGNAGIVNVSVPDLLNTTNVRFVGRGGYTTQGAPGSGPAGGNGGNVILNFHGLIKNLTATAYPTYKPDLAGGNSTSSIYGSTGTLIYNKNMSCPRDADINGDGLVYPSDVQTLTLLFSVYGYPVKEDEAGFNDNYDINCDGKINVIDIARIGFEYLTR